MKALKSLIFPCMDRLKEAGQKRDEAIKEFRCALNHKPNKFNGMVSCGLSAIPVRDNNDEYNRNP